MCFFCQQYHCASWTVCICVCIIVVVISESVDGSYEDFDDMEFGYEVELDQSADYAGMSYEDDQ